MLVLVAVVFVFRILDVEQQPSTADRQPLFFFPPSFCVSGRDMQGGQGCGEKKRQKQRQASGQSVGIVPRYASSSM